MWGPRQGEYLREEILRLYGVWAGTNEPSDEPDPLIPFAHDVEQPYLPEQARTPGAILEDAPAQVSVRDAVTMTVAGEDPWLGVPRVVVLDASGDVVLRPGGQPLDGDDLDFDVSLSVEPPYTEEDGEVMRAERLFSWQLRLAPRSPLPGGLDLSGGTYVLAVTLPRADGSETTVTSTSFEVLSAN
jgi:hypothetical protein